MQTAEVMKITLFQMNEIQHHFFIYFRDLLYIDALYFMELLICSNYLFKV